MKESLVDQTVPTAWCMLIVGHGLGGWGEERNFSPGHKVFLHSPGGTSVLFLKYRFYLKIKTIFIL